MNWYYALNGQQQGPVSEVEFTGLVNTGVVTDQTLVWHEGMANWQPHGELKAQAPAATALPPIVQPPASSTGEVVCAECGGIFPQDQTVQLAGVYVCAACKPLHLQKLKEGMTTAVPGAMRYAGFWIRFVAKIVDGLIIGVVMGIPAVLFMLTMFSRISTLQNAQGPPVEFVVLYLIFVFLSYAVPIAYNTYFIGRFGATLGKMAVGVRVVTAENQHPTYMRAFGRAWAVILSGMICDIGYIIAGFDDQKRALHDHICSTRVVMK